MIRRLVFAILAVLAVWGLQRLLVFLIDRRRRSKYPKGWILREDAERKQDDVRRKWKRRMDAGEPASAEFFAELAEAGRIGAPLIGDVRLNIAIPEPIGPIDRCAKYEDPLRLALGEFGCIAGGGTLAVDGASEALIDVTVKEIDRGLALVRESLRTQGAPKGTVIRHAGQAYPLYEGP